MDKISIKDIKFEKVDLSKTTPNYIHHLLSFKFPDYKINFKLNNAYSELANYIRITLLSELKVKYLTFDISTLETDDKTLIPEALLEKIELMPIDQSIPDGTKFYIYVKNLGFKDKIIHSNYIRFGEDKRIQKDIELLKHVKEKQKETKKKINYKDYEFIESAKNNEEYFKGTHILHQLRSNYYVYIPKIVVRSDYGYNSGKQTIVRMVKCNPTDIQVRRIEGDFQEQNEIGDDVFVTDPKNFEFELHTLGTIQPIKLLQDCFNNVISKLKSIKYYDNDDKNKEENILTFQQKVVKKIEQVEAFSIQTEIKDNYKLTTYEIKSECRQLCEMISYLIFNNDQNIGFVSAFTPILMDRNNAVKIIADKPDKHYNNAIDSLIDIFTKLLKQIYSVNGGFDESGIDEFSFTNMYGNFTTANQELLDVIGLDLIKKYKNILLDKFCLLKQDEKYFKELSTFYDLHMGNLLLTNYIQGDIKEQIYSLFTEPQINPFDKTTTDEVKKILKQNGKVNYLVNYEKEIPNLIYQSTPHLCINSLNRLMLIINDSDFTGYILDHIKVSKEYRTLYMDSVESAQVLFDKSIELLNFYTSAQYLGTKYYMNELLKKSFDEKIIEINDNTTEIDLWNTIIEEAKLKPEINGILSTIKQGFKFSSTKGVEIIITDDDLIYIDPLALNKNNELITDENNIEIKVIDDEGNKEKKVKEEKREKKYQPIVIEDGILKPLSKWNSDIKKQIKEMKREKIGKYLIKTK